MVQVLQSGFKFRKFHPAFFTGLEQLQRFNRENNWHSGNFKRHAEHNGSGYIAHSGLIISGSIAYHKIVEHRAIMIDNIVVRPEDRRRGLGRQLVHRLRSMMGDDFTKIVTYVRESNLGSQQFWSKIGFFAVEIGEGYFLDYLPDDSKKEEAGYCFELRLDGHYPKKIKKTNYRGHSVVRTRLRQFS